MRDRNLRSHFHKCCSGAISQAAFVFKLTGDPNEEVEFKLEITRPTGGTLGSMGGKIKVPLLGTVDVITNLQGLPLPDLGLYGFGLYLGGAPAKTIGVTVAIMPAATHTGEAPPP